MDARGSLTLQMMTIESLHKKEPSEGNPDSRPAVNPKSWYSLIGKPLLMELVGCVRLYRKCVMMQGQKAEHRGLQRVKVLGFRNRRCLQHRKCSKTADLHWKISLIFPGCRWMR